MPLINGGRYPAARRVGINTTTGKLVFIQHDPCGAATGVKAVRRIGTNLATGKPVYALRDCITAAPANGTRYTGTRQIGTNTTSGKPVFALGCQQCGNGTPCCPEIELPDTLYATFGAGACAGNCYEPGVIGSKIFPPPMALTRVTGQALWRGCAFMPYPPSPPGTRSGTVYPNPCPEAEFFPDDVDLYWTVRATFLCGTISGGEMRGQYNCQAAGCAVAPNTGVWLGMPCELAWTHNLWFEVLTIPSVPLVCSPFSCSGQRECFAGTGKCYSYDFTA